MKSFVLFHPRKSKALSGIVRTKKKYFGLGKYWIGVGIQWLECGEHRVPVLARTNSPLYIDIWYFTCSIYKQKELG
jgi:hypothetical protein